MMLRGLIPIFAVSFAVSLGGCDSSSTGAATPLDAGPLADARQSIDQGEMMDVSPPMELAAVDYLPPRPPVPRLTQTQIKNSLQDIFGPSIVVTGLADPDTSASGFVAVGAGISTISPRGVEGVEAMAYRVATQALSEENRARVLGCSLVDPECASDTLTSIGRRLWRRSMTDDERTRAQGIFDLVNTRLNDPNEALAFTIAYLIQSPNFLFRKELGVDGQYTGVELASRLSFLLWNRAPDVALLDSAERGELDTTDGLRATIDRMLESPLTRTGFLRFFSEWFALNDLDRLNKDPIVFPSLSADLGLLARTETLLGFERLVFDEDGDFRSILTSRRTFVDRKLAALYGIRAPVREGFGEVDLPEDGVRRGLLGQASFLIGNSHPVSTSATLRGKFVRERLLCHIVPPPPADVDTSIPEPSGRRQTLRERVAEHLQEDSCAGCHLITDPIGLAFENFDGLGVFRRTDNGGLIDPSGELDGSPFSDASELAERLHEHPDFARCVAIHLHRFVTGTVESIEQYPMMDALKGRFTHDGYRIKALLTEVLMSRIFRNTAPAEEDSE